MPSRIAFLVFATFLAAVSGLTAACGSAAPAESQPLTMAHLHDMPAEVQAAPVAVQDAYRFAAANPDILGAIPCYCGCGPIGHTSNYDCYWQVPGPDGSLAFDAHALGCKICVDITADAMRLTAEGESPGAIKDYVDTAYGRYGPSNMP